MDYTAVAAAAAAAVGGLYERRGNISCTLARLVLHTVVCVSHLQLFWGHTVAVAIDSDH